MMRRVLQGLPTPGEFVFVGVRAVGLPVVISLEQMFRPVVQSAVSDAGLKSLIGYELAVMIALVAFLRARGWTIERIGIRITAKDTLIGLAFALAAELIGMGALLLIQPISPQ